MAVYKPEGRMPAQTEDAAQWTELDLQRAMIQGTILEGRAILCDKDHNLLVQVGGFTGFMPRKEAAMGIREGTAREIAIISRVNKPVAFRIMDIARDGQDIVPILSRARVQEECLSYCLSHLSPGDVIEARVTHLEPFGAFVDIGCGVTSLITIDNISISRIAHPADRFTVGQGILAVVKEIDFDLRRISLSHKELLGTWEENAALFTPGQTVSGIIRSVESYGTFIELTPNLAGLAEPSETLTQGHTAAVYIKNIIPEKMKLKLSVIDASPEKAVPAPFHYFITGGHIDRWQYSPDQCSRRIESVF